MLSSTDGMAAWEGMMKVHSLAGTCLHLTILMMFRIIEHMDAKERDSRISYDLASCYVAGRLRSYQKVYIA